MIFVTIGTHELQFNRLLSYIEKLDINEEIIVQSGNTKFESERYKVVDFMDSKEFEQTIKRCELLVCHGGIGSILEGLRKQKKIISVPRLSKYGEHNDDHQLEITSKMEKEGYILKCVEYEEFKKLIEEYKKVEFKKYKFNNEQLVKFIDLYISKI